MRDPLLRQWVTEEALATHHPPCVRAGRRIISSRMDDPVVYVTPALLNTIGVRVETATTGQWQLVLPGHDLALRDLLVSCGNPTLVRHEDVVAALRPVMARLLSVSSVAGPVAIIESFACFDDARYGLVVRTQATGSPRPAAASELMGTAWRCLLNVSVDDRRALGEATLRIPCAQTRPDPVRVTTVSDANDALSIGIHQDTRVTLARGSPTAVVGLWPSGTADFPASLLGPRAAEPETRWCVDVRLCSALGESLMASVLGRSSVLTKCAGLTLTMRDD